MEVAMLDLIVGIGIILVLLLLLKLLDYFDVFDILDLFAAIARLATGAIALLAALLLWTARKLTRAGEAPMHSPDQKSSAPRGSSRTRATVRNGRSGAPALRSNSEGPQEFDRKS
jgi:uncharacterized membrane protein YedE/YeeE